MDTRRLVSRASLIESEAVQRKAWHLLSSAAPSDIAAALQVRVKEVESTLYQGALQVPGAQFNKVFSFGLEGAISAGAIEAASHWLTHDCCERSWLMAPPVEPPGDTEARLRRAGYQRHPLDITILHRDADAAVAVAPPPGIDVRPVLQDDAEAFGRVLSEGLGSTAAAAWLAAFAVGHAGLTAYLAYEGAEAIGAASLFVDGNRGWLFIAAVRPAYRNRGAQTALLARRLHDGREAGVRTFNVGALRPTPGHDDLFASYRNIQRAGFEVAYDRPNYLLPRDNRHG